MKRIHSFCIAALMLGQGALACSWIPSPFCATSNERPDDVVLSGRIVGTDMDGIDLEVIHVLKGSESRDTIRIWDGTDFDCNGLFSMAAADLGGLNDSIIVVLPMITTIENAWDVLGDYRSPYYFGATPSLIIRSGLVNGYYAGPSWSPMAPIPYLEFMANWNNGPNHCSTYLSIEATDLTPPFAAHLVHTTLNLTIRDDVALGSTIRMYAANGQEVVAEKGITGSMRIDLSGLSAGMYNIILAQQDGSRSFARIMKF